MLRLLKRFWWMGLFVAVPTLLFGYGELGPNNEAYQVPDIGYMLAPGPHGTDLGAPKDFNQEYRRNTPTMYYACDANFYLFFGDQGVAAIDSAFAVLNSLNPVDSYTNLTEFPFETKRKNWQAEALLMVDLKTLTLELLMEQMGLAEPSRYTWGLHNRYLPPGAACPVGETYLIVKRNFDPDTFAPSSYVNNVLLTYALQELCAGGPPVAVTLPFPADPLADVYTAVAERSATYGDFYTFLSRDDMGGLRYLLRTNNVNYESPGPGTTLYLTNSITNVLMVTSNLTLLAAQALTNDPATLAGLYPGLIVASSTNYYANIYTTTITTNYGNLPWDPVGTPPHPISYVTNVVGTPTLIYSNTFGNLFIVEPVAGGGFTAVPLLTIPTGTNQIMVTVDTTIVSTGGRVNACTFNPNTGGVGPWTPVGTNAVTSTNIFTNTCSITYATNGVGGDFLILPTNTCSLQILASQITNVIAITNALVTNTVALVNTNSSVAITSYAQNQITYFTNHTYVVQQATCAPVATFPTLIQGIGKINFVRVNYDSLTGRFFYPITNGYVLNSVTNYQIVPLQVQRAITAPDFLFTATDLTAGPAAGPPGAQYATIYTRNINFDAAFINPGLAGPGTIEPSTTITFDNTPAYMNTGLASTNAFLGESTQTNLFVYATFDGSTNAPIVYPNSLSLGQLENQMLVQVNAVFPPGRVGQPYTGTLQAVVSGTPARFPPQYSWSASPGSLALLPPGLNLLGSGVVTGTPTKAGTFDFMVRVTDSLGDTVDRSFAIVIGP